MDWILYLVIGITIFEIIRAFWEDREYMSFSRVTDFFTEPEFVYFVLFFGIIYLLGILEFRLLLVCGIALYFAIRFFKNEHKEMKKKKMGFFEKIIEYISLILLTLLMVFAICMFDFGDIEKYDRKQKAKEIHQQIHQQQSTHTPNQRYSRP